MGIAIDKATQNHDTYLKRALRARRRKTCGYLNYWHVHQLIVQSYTTILAIIVASNLEAWYHWFLLDFHMCVFWTHFIQIFIWNRYKGRTWDATFEPSHMLNVHYNIHFCIYVGYLFLLKLCFLFSCYLWVFNNLCSCCVHYRQICFSYFFEIRELYAYMIKKVAANATDVGGS